MRKQFLDKHAKDITAISYSEKLDRFLSEVLVGDSLAEQIRAAFDAYIFLSYRKKDRAYAQKRMELIHENDLCRDIVIWVIFSVTVMILQKRSSIIVRHTISFHI